MKELEVRENLRKYEGIITGGLMDSFALAELGVYIEGEFDVYIPDPELTVGHMDTLDKMVSRVMQGIASQ
jgi:acyl carrier protein